MKNMLRACTVVRVPGLLFPAAAQAAKTEASEAAPQLIWRCAFADCKPYKAPQDNAQP